MAKQFLIISRGSDEPSIALVSEKEMATRLEQFEDYFGSNTTFLDKVPDMEYMPENSAFIMVGEVVIPKPEKVVTKWKI